MKTSSPSNLPELILPTFQHTYPPEILDNIYNEFHPYQKAYKSLINFVELSTSSRPPSHSHLHMAQVAKISTLLYQHLYPQDIALNTPLSLMVTLAAYLHDVADHKYDTPDKIVSDYLTEEWANITKQIIDNGYVLGDWTIEKLMDIVKIVSFSKEKKWRLLKLGLITDNADPKWQSLEIDPSTLTQEQRDTFSKYGDELGQEGQIVRNIVSDADKIEAIGIRGVERCWQYSEELWEKKVH
jgi:hypothetical protein